MTEHGTPLVFSVISRVPATFGIGSVGLAVLLFFLPIPSTELLRGLLALGVFAALMGAIVYHRRGTLTIGEHLEYRRGRTQFELSRDQAVEVFIRRPWLGSRLPTDYLLRVSVESRTFLLPFAEHWLDGRAAMRDAHTVAQVLGVPVVDERGDRLRASRNPLARWQGAGQDWKVLAFAVCVGALAALALLAIVGPG